MVSPRGVVFDWVQLLPWFRLRIVRVSVPVATSLICIVLLGARRTCVRSTKTIAILLWSRVRTKLLGKSACFAAAARHVACCASRYSPLPSTLTTSAAGGAAAACALANASVAARAKACVRRCISSAAA